MFNFTPEVAPLQEKIKKVFDVLERETDGGFEKNNQYRAQEKGLLPLTQEEWVEKVIQSRREVVQNYQKKIDEFQKYIDECGKGIEEADEKIKPFKDYVSRLVEAGGYSPEHIQEARNDLQEAQSFYDADKYLELIGSWAKARDEHKKFYEDSKRILDEIDSLDA